MLIGSRWYNDREELRLVEGCTGGIGASRSSRSECDVRLARTSWKEKGVNGCECGKEGKEHT